MEFDLGSRAEAMPARSPEEPSTRRKPKFRERRAAEAPARPASRPRKDVEPLPSAEAPPRTTPVVRLTVEQAVWVALIFTAFLLRFVGDGSRPMHGDESVHAWLAWNLYRGAGYQYDPVYHGPLQFIVTSFLFFLFGVSNLSARLMAITFGTALVGALSLLRPYVGRSTALICAVFVALSPAFVYVSRLERDDIFTSFFAFTLAVSLFSFVRTRRAAWFYGAAASVALSLAAMENTYITLFVFGSFLVLALAGEYLAEHSPISFATGRLVGSRGPGGLDRTQLAVVGASVLIAFLLTVLTNSYVPVPLVVAAALVFLVVRQSFAECTASGRTPITDAVRGITGREWLNAAAIVVAIIVLTFSTFGSNLRGIWDASQPILNTSGHACAANSYILDACRKDVLGGLFYWLSQHQVHRGGQPWYYYGLLYGLYEQIGLVLGIGGLVLALRRSSLFTVFLVYWGLLMLGIYSWAGEKFSWLMIHPLLPFLILAGMFVAAVFRAGGRARIALVSALAVLGLLQLHNMVEVNYVNGADPVEMMVYVQSTPATTRVADNILALSNKVANGPGMHVTVDAAETWPFAWYLRDMPNVAYPASSQMTSSQYLSNPVLLVDDADDAAVAPLLHGRYSARHERLRWWFPEAYKAWTWSSVVRDLADPSTWSAISQWQIQRRAFGPKESVDFYYYVKRGLASPY